MVSVRAILLVLGLYCAGIGLGHYIFRVPVKSIILGLRLYG